MALLAARPEGTEGGHSGKVAVFLLKGQFRLRGAGDITHQCLDLSRFGCLRWPTVPSTWSSITGNMGLIWDFYANWSRL